VENSTAQLCLPRSSAIKWYAGEIMRVSGAILQEITLTGCLLGLLLGKSSHIRLALLALADPEARATKERALSSIISHAVACGL
jgi:hypothetical protein